VFWYHLTGWRLNIQAEGAVQGSYSAALPEVRLIP
jgi:hypothetical protein